MKPRRLKKSDPNWKPGAGIWRTCIRCGGHGPRGEMRQVKDGKRMAYQHRGDCLRAKRIAAKESRP